MRRVHLRKRASEWPVCGGEEQDLSPELEKGVGSSEDSRIYFPKSHIWEEAELGYDAGESNSRV